MVSEKYDEILGPYIGKKVIFRMPYLDGSGKFSITKIEGTLTKGAGRLYGIDSENAHII